MTMEVLLIIKLLIGGSPCTKWSIAQTKSRETTAEGIGWELFRNYLTAKEKYYPDYFLYENNKSMAPSIREQITKELGVEPILINSALVSGQSRHRLYWTNIPNVQQPEDHGVLLRDVLESGVCWREKAYTIDSNYFKTLGQQGFEKQSGRRKMAAEKVTIKALTENEMDYMVRETKGGRNHFDFDYFHDANKDKSSCVTANTYRGVPYNVLTEPVRIGTIESTTTTRHDSKPFRIYSPDGKSVTLQGEAGGIGAKTGLYAIPTEDGFIATNGLAPNGKVYPIYHVSNGLITIRDKQYPIKLADGYYIIRKLTVLECMRLQTVPETYIFPVSDTQAYKMLGNGWTVDVIAHILSHCSNITTDVVEVLSMYDGMSCGHIALDKLGANVERYYATEIDKYAVKTTMENYPNTIQLGDAFQVREDGWTPYNIMC